MAQLSGIKVLDLSRVLAGPWATQLLADMGAEVIKVERSGSGDDTRTWGPPWAWEHTAAYFTCTNRGKKSVTADFDDLHDLALIKKLALQADVVIENFKVGQLARFGLDYSSLQKLNPRLIYCSITGYGQDGPMADQPGYDFAIQAFSGLMSITGPEGGEPQKVGVAVVDIVTGLYAANAILAAVISRHQTGKGSLIDCALMDCGVALLANQASNYLVGHTVPKAMGNTHPSIVPYQCFSCRDGYVVIAVGNDRQFSNFCAALGEPWASDRRFVSNPQRVKHRDELIPMICDQLKTRTQSEVIELMGRHGVPCTPVQSIDQVMEGQYVKNRGLLVDYPQQQLPSQQKPQAVRGVAQPVKFDGKRPVSSMPPPVLGERISEQTFFGFQAP